MVKQFINITKVFFFMQIYQTGPQIVVYIQINQLEMKLATIVSIYTYQFFLYHIHYVQNLNFHILPQFTFSFINFVHKHVIVNRKLKKTFIYKHQKYEYHLILLYIFFYSFLKAFLYVSITIQNLIELAKLCTCV